MSEEAKDIRTAEEFLKIFETEDKKLKKKYVGLFLNSFLRGYRKKKEYSLVEGGISWEKLLLLLCLFRIW